MAEAKKHKVGETFETKDSVEVTRPDGTTLTFIGGEVVLSQSGTWVVDGTEIKVT